MTDVTLIGLGQMGAALGEAMLKAGQRVTVWNRTAARANSLVHHGAQLARGARQRGGGGWAGGQGADYPEGALFPTPSQIGRPDTPIFLSGSESAYTRAGPALK